MIRKYRIGNPIPTDCCVTDIPVSHASIPYFERNDEAKELSYTLSKKTRSLVLVSQSEVLIRGAGYISAITRMTQTTRRISTHCMLRRISL